MLDRNILSPVSMMLRRTLLLLCMLALAGCVSPLRAQAVSVTNVFQNHYHYGYAIGTAARDCPTGYNIPSGQYSSAYHLERGHAIHHADPINSANDYWVYWAHFDNGSYGVAEVAVFKSTTECGPYILQTGLSSSTNTDGAGYGFQPGGWQSRDENIFRDSDQTYNPDGSVATYASAYLITASNSLNTISGHACSYANDSIAAFKMTPDYMGIDTTTSPSSNGANWIFPCAQREAPVMFRQGSSYFLIVSQAAGWYPSQGAYGSSSNPLTGFPTSPVSLGNTSTFGGQTSDGFAIEGTSATTYILAFDHLGGDDSKNPAANDKRDTGVMYLPVILNGATGTATLAWEPSFTVDNTTGVLTLPTLTNLATTSTATATTYSGTSNLPSAAIDGNYTTRWAYAATSGTATVGTGSAAFNAATTKTSTLCPVTGAVAATTCSPSLVVDMGSVQPVQEINLSWYMIKGSEPYYTFKIAYSSDNINWTTLDYTSFASASNAAASNLSIVPFGINNTYGFNALPVNFSARYVALTETSEVVQNNSPGNYGPNIFEMGIIKSTAPTSPQPVTVALTPSSYAPPTDSSFTVGVTVTGPTGQPTPTGYIQLSAPGYLSETYGLVSGANSFTIPAGATTGGAETITVSFRPDPSSAPIYGIGTTTGTANISVSAPDAPTGLTLSQTGPGVLTVSWTVSTGASSYVLYRSSNGGSSYTQLATPTTTSYVDSGLANDSTTYCYTVTALNSGGASAQSASSCGMATANFPVTNITLTQNGSVQLTVAYTAVANATGYIVKRSTAGGAYAQIAAPTTTTYTDTGLTNGVNYCYTVAAVFSSGNAADSAPVCATVSAAIASVTINGFSFESPVTSTYSYAPAISGTAQPWTFTASGTSIGSGVTTNASGFTAGNSVAPAGTQVAFLQGKGVAYQTVTGLTVGTTYRITEAASQRANKSGGQLGNPYEVRVDGTAIATVMATQGTTTYTDFSQTFTATATSHVIGFYGTNANANTTYPDNTVFIDNIRMISYPAAAASSSTPNYLWLVNNTGTLTRTDEQGTVLSSAVGTGGSAATYGGVAIDAFGGVWSVSSASNLVSYVTKAGASPATYTDPSLNAPTAIAIDGAGTVWIANSGGTAICAFTSAGVLKSIASDSSIQGTSGIAIDISGNVWIADATSNTVDEVLGAAAPVAPLAVAVTSNTPGARP